MPVGTSGDLVADRYRMQRRLGAGGMATVFLARDERLERDVAIKRLHADSAEDVARRFQREAKVGASLNHPNIVGVYDTVTDDEGVLIVMEYVPGHTLRDEIARGPMDPGRAIEVLFAVASALDNAHEQGVVHRDVKPANVLIDDRGGVVKVADLGIATAAAQTRITHSGAVLGTASYMAPERLDGGAGDRAVDVYSLAAVAFEMLSGRKAVDGSSPLEIARRVATAPPADLRASLPTAPEAAALALKRGLAKRPEDRQRSAGDLVRELAAAYAAQAESEHSRRATAPLGGAEESFSGHGHGNRRGVAAAAVAERAHDAPSPRAAAAAPLLHGAAPRRRWVVPAALALALAALVAIVALSSGGGSGKPSASSTGAKQNTGGAAKQKPAPKSQAQGGGSSTPAPAAPAPAQGGGSSGAAAAGDTSTPTGVVSSFYKTSIDDPHAAWAMGTDNLHKQLISESSFANQESTLKSIDFPLLQMANQSGNAATVQFRSIARHTTKTDRCSGTISVVKGSNGWMVDHLNVAPCKSGPPS
jgi:serine/threonine-protein kinase